MKQVLVTGGTGFLGVNVLRSLLDESTGISVRCLVHSPGTIVPSLTDSTDVMPGDVTIPASLEGKFRDIHTVVHLASKIVASDPSEYERVNVGGTRNVAERCVKEGVRHIVYVSSAAIYGCREARGVEEYEPAEPPVTPVSRSRYEAEKILLGYHNRNRITVSILRPLFVYGDGDRFFIPSILRTLRRFPFMINRGKARFSVIAAHELGDLIADLINACLPPTDYPVYHATDGSPVSLEELVRILCEELHLKFPSVSLPYHVAVPAMIVAAAKNRLLLRPRDRSSGTLRDASNLELRHRAHLVSYDHYYSNRRLTEALPGVNFSTFAEQIRMFIPYYRSTLPP